jgi:hypothetical protein
MSRYNDNFREWDKTNLIDDILIEFPKLKNDIIIRRSDGSFVHGIIMKSNIYKNHYAEWDDAFQSWFLPIHFFDPIKGSMYKFMDINDLTYSYFTYNEIIIIKTALKYGIRRDIHDASPIFTSISRDIRTFKNNFKNKENKENKENNESTNFNPDDFLNLPPLKI